MDASLLTVVITLLALLPVAIVAAARRSGPSPEVPAEPARGARLRGILLYAALVALLAGAANLDGLPAALAVESLLLGLLGMGYGVRPLYRYLNGSAWLAAHPGVEMRDAGRWQRLTLVLAVLALAVAVVLAFGSIDIVLSPEG